MVKNVIGLMSGTSLDGLDICYASFERGEDGSWKYSILKAMDYPYPDDLKNKLATAQNMSAQEYALLNSDYGIYLGKKVMNFMEQYGFVPDLIASHGHTIFHQPNRRFTAQIGSGAGIAAETGVDCVCDFRTTDVALHGQGAPLVPIGDRVLFADYDYCLNLGGFSNISFDDGDSRCAYDICPVNYVMNYYTRREVEKEYDVDGNIARSGKISSALFSALNELDFYKMNGPKSLGREWVENEVIPLIDSFNLSLADRLCTFCEHIAYQIGSHISGGKVLLTGGGALNVYLVERMSALAPQCTYFVPDKLTVNFKEALIFAFLGVLYWYDIPNCLSSVTGASYNCVGGALYKGRKR